MSLSQFWLSGRWLLKNQKYKWYIDAYQSQPTLSCHDVDEISNRSKLFVFWVVRCLSLTALTASECTMFHVLFSMAVNFSVTQHIFSCLTTRYIYVAPINIPVIPLTSENYVLAYNYAPPP